MGKKFKAGDYYFTCAKCDGEGKVKSKKCKKCDGNGKIKVYVEECYECGGKKRVECDCTGGLGKEKADDDCPACGGQGKHICPACDGRGYDVKCLIDAGVEIDASW